jgi:hypothetical protein
MKVDNRLQGSYGISIDPSAQTGIVDIAGKAGIVGTAVKLYSEMAKYGPPLLEGADESR